MDKRELILDALQELLDEGKAGIASVSDIAKKANIAKGGLYYYFKSKEEVFDALAQRQYSNVVAACDKALAESDLDALANLKLLLNTYRSTTVAASIDRHLHSVENAAIHQKSMASILLQLTPLVEGILKQGIAEGVFTCERPKETAEIMLSALVFLLDPGVFAWTQQEAAARLQALARMMESGLQAPQESFSFLYEDRKRQSPRDR